MFIHQKILSLTPVFPNIQIFRSFGHFFGHLFFYPPASKASKEVANLTERDNPHKPVYGVKEFCLLQTLTPIFSGLAKQNGPNFFKEIYGKNPCLKKIICSMAEVKFWLTLPNLT